MKGRLLKVLFTLSLLLFVAVVVLWLRSYVVSDHHVVANVVAGGDQLSWSHCGIHIGGGSLMFGGAANAAPDPAMATQLTPWAGRGWSLVYSRSQPSINKTLWCAPTNAMGFAMVREGAGVPGWGYQLAVVVPFWCLAAACALLPIAMLARRSLARRSLSRTGIGSRRPESTIRAEAKTAAQPAHDAIRGRLANLLALPVLLAFLAVVVLWGRSMSVTDWAALRGPNFAYNVLSYRGWIILQRAEVPAGFQPQRWRADAGSDWFGMLAVPCVDTTADKLWSRIGLIAVPARVPWEETAPQAGSSTSLVMNSRNLWLPHWLLAVASAWLPARYAWAAGRAIYRGNVGRYRASLGLCPGCGYDVRASAERCPECGETLTRPDPAHPTPARPAPGSEGIAERPVRPSMVEARYPYGARRPYPWIIIPFALMIAAALAVYLVWSTSVFNGLQVRVATPGQLAASQARYDRTERISGRGDDFFQLTIRLDQRARGVSTAQQIVQSLGAPDGYWQSGDRSVLVYYYDRFGKKDWAAVAELRRGVLVNFSYTTASAYPPSALQSYPQLGPTPTQPTTPPATAPAPADGQVRSESDSHQ